MKFYLFFNILKVMSIFLIFVFFACDNPSSNHKIAEDSKGSVVKSSYTRSRILKSGQYGEMSIAVDSNNYLTGVYEYYDGWDEKYKEYMQICKFYFSGRLKDNDSIIKIYSYWPDKQQGIEGKVKVGVSADRITLGLYLKDSPLGYAAVDFTNENAYYRDLDKQKNWIQIRIIKSDKCRLYDSPDLSKARKAYIVKYDIVKILSKSNGWFKVEYNAPNDNGKSILAWIKEADVFEIAVDK